MGCRMLFATFAVHVDNDHQPLVWHQERSTQTIMKEHMFMPPKATPLVGMFVIQFKFDQSIFNKSSITAIFTLRQNYEVYTDSPRQQSTESLLGHKTQEKASLRCNRTIGYGIHATKRADQSMVGSLNSSYTSLNLSDNYDPDLLECTISQHQSAQIHSVC